MKHDHWFLLFCVHVSTVKNVQTKTQTTEHNENKFMKPFKKPYKSRQKPKKNGKPWKHGCKSPIKANNNL